jgi:hypothetical protein
MSDFSMGENPSYIEYTKPTKMEERELPLHIVLLPLSPEAQVLVDAARRDLEDRDQILDSNLNKLMSRGAAMYKALYNPERAGKF